MKTIALTAAALLLVFAAPLYAAGITGQYVEARTCDVWTAPCFANAEMNLTGKHAVMGWKVEKGKIGDVSLDGLGVVAIVEATDTLGLEQSGPAKAILLVDKKANASQREALIALAKKLGGSLTKNIVAVETKPIELALNHCKDGGCAILDAGVARIETRCVDKDHDKVCGNEGNYYEPLTEGVKATAAVATEHSFTGKGFNKTWKDGNRRSAYIGTFSVE